MSDWIRYYRNKQTKEIVKVHAMDDYFDHYVYGYKIIKSGKVFNEEDFAKEYEDFKHEVVGDERFKEQDDG